MIERVTGEAWEDLLRERLFEPLGMTSAGFGAPATPGKVDQPWGHLGEIGELHPVEPGPLADNPPAIGPAATVHASRWPTSRAMRTGTPDWHRADPQLLDGGDLQPFAQAGAGPGLSPCGWLVEERDWGGGDVLWQHRGPMPCSLMPSCGWRPTGTRPLWPATNAAHREADDGCNDADHRAHPPRARQVLRLEFEDRKVGVWNGGKVRQSAAVERSGFRNLRIPNSHQYLRHRWIDFHRPGVDPAREVRHIAESIAEQKFRGPGGTTAVVALNEQAVAPGQ